MKKQNPTTQPSLNVMSISTSRYLECDNDTASVRAEPVLSLTKGQFELVDLSLWENNKFVSLRSMETHPLSPLQGGEKVSGWTKGFSSPKDRSSLPGREDKGGSKILTHPRFLWMAVILTLLFLLPNIIHAQPTNLPQTKVILEGGASAQARADMAGKVESILAGINAWHGGDASILEAEPAGQQLIALISDDKLYSLYDTLAADVFTYGDEFEIPKITLLPDGGDLFDFEQVIFTLNSSYDLVAVRSADKSQSIDRILARDIEVDAQEEAAGLALLEKYKTAFEGKDAEGLRNLFSEDPIILSGSRARNFDGFVLKRSQPDDYFDRLNSRTLVAGNTINITFTEATVRRHPDVAGYYGVTAKQDYRTSAYSDVGYIYFIANLEDPNNPKIVYRQWQEGPFSLSEFAIKTPDPVAMKIGLDKVEESSESILEITLSTEAAMVLTPERLAGFLSDGTLRFEGITVTKSGITQTEQGIQAMFTSEGTQLSLPTGIVLRENNVLLGFEGSTTLYAGQRNILGMSTLEEHAEYIQEDLSGEALVSLNVDSATVRITSEKGKELARGVQTQREASYTLMAGSYQIQALKSGYIDTTSSFVVEAGKLAMVELTLELIPVAPPPPPVIAKEEPKEEKKKAAFFTRKRLIYGAVAALAVGAYFALNPDDPNYLPVPPGRPGPTAKR